MREQLTVPELGDFEDVEVIEVLVAPGDAVAVEDALITLESDKASMDIPASRAGTVVSVDVKVGDRVSTGSAVVTIDVEEKAAPATQEEKPAEPSASAAGTPATPATETIASPKPAGDATHQAQLVVIGAGPGGYTAAFRAADLGLDVILIERYAALGGVCLNVGCIPSKALLHAAKIIDDAEAMAEHGVRFGKPEIDAGKLRDWKNQVIGKLTGGLSSMAKQRKVRVLQNTARFIGANRLQLDNDETVDFEQCIIAVGSQPMMLPGLPDDPRIVDSTGALELAPLPKRMLVVGGGIIGLEMACVYAALGTSVSVVELTDTLMPGTDPDLLRPFLKVVRPRYEAIMVSTKVTGMQATDDGIKVEFEGDKAPPAETYDRVLVAIGRKANGNTVD
ncbi:MAG: dihydrolipoyl dehydrogenase, partial [Gammaproteobacteria bacterium]|nr:dihydrolipoyl dehydrogenase [Gammaproteobacteria bacterium]